MTELYQIEGKMVKADRLEILITITPVNFNN